METYLLEQLDKT